jgi:hypothetical protein
VRRGAPTTTEGRQGDRRGSTADETSARGAQSDLAREGTSDDEVWLRRKGGRLKKSGEGRRTREDPEAGWAERIGPRAGASGAKETAGRAGTGRQAQAAPGRAGTLAGPIERGVPAGSSGFPSTGHTATRSRWSTSTGVELPMTAADRWAGWPIGASCDLAPVACILRVDDAGRRPDSQPSCLSRKAGYYRSRSGATRDAMLLLRKRSPTASRSSKAPQ